jgi:hypothetical protein
MIASKEVLIYKDVKGKKGKIAPDCAIKAYGWSRGINHTLLTLELDGGEWSVSHLGHCNLRGDPLVPVA